MPWTVSDVDKHKKGLDKTQKQKWVRIANSVLKECQSTRNDGKECEAQAIRVANSKVGSGDSSKSKDESSNGE
jgi:uncharacterized protein YdaT